MLFWILGDSFVSSPIVKWLSFGFDFLGIVFFNNKTYIISGNIIKKDYVRIFLYSWCGVFNWKKNKELTLSFLS